MADRSQKKTDFLGLYIEPDLKEQVEREAKAEGVSVSEKVRRELRKGTEAEKVPATT